MSEAHNLKDQTPLSDSIKPNQRRRTLALHPILFALYSPIALLAANIQEILIQESYRSFSVILLVSMLLFLVLRLILRDWHRAATVCSLLLIAFFSYGHVYDALKNTTIRRILIGRHRFLLPVYIGTLATGLWFALKKLSNPVNMTQALNIIAIVAVLAPAISITRYFLIIRNDWDAGKDYPNLLSGESLTFEDAAKPDIYYLILDGYSRSDYLRDYLDYDNEDFLDFLRDRGFYVVEKSNSNHNQTALSLASSLNMNYAQNLGLKLIPGNYPWVFIEPIRHSRVRYKLESLGYITVATRTSYIPTEIPDAEYFFEPDVEGLNTLSDRSMLNAYESMLFHSTALKILADFWSTNSSDDLKPRTSYPDDLDPLSPYPDDLDPLSSYPYALLRETILAQLDNLSKIPFLPGPKFVFVHVISPHDPYLFGPNGEDIHQTGPFSLLATGENAPSPSDIQLYRDQAFYISSRVMEAVESILQNSETTPIIILQADHGERGLLAYVDTDEDGTHPRAGSAILNALLLPGGCDRFLYPQITPVNTFRVIFNCYFGDSYQLLEDNVYYTHRAQKRYEFDLLNVNQD